MATKRCVNTPKAEAYALAFRMIKDAIIHNCPLQAITIEESILADRLYSTLNVGLEESKLGTLNQALNLWHPKSPDQKISPNANRFDEEMERIYPQLRKWWDERNNLMHGIVKSHQGCAPELSATEFYYEAVKAAVRGLDLANFVKDWTQKQVRKAARSKAKK